ncbi:MAG: methylcobamide--CoM methyltransferase [Syntrophomonadaceae bacterium]|nr:methylcobamide--CoM methyltransferase [Syntrophomonadaceae bacterium]
MNAKHRLVKALQGLPIDRPPFICPGGMMNMVTSEVLEKSGLTWPLAYGDPGLLAELAKGAAELTGIENLGIPFCMTVEAESLGADVEMGTLYSEPRIIRPLMLRISEWVNLTGFDFAQGRMANIIQAVRELASTGSGLPIIVSLTGPISLAATLMEAMEFFGAMHNQAHEVHGFLQFLTSNLIQYARSLQAAGADILVVADPSASGEILGPRNFAAFAGPYLNLLLDEGGQGYAGHMLHICGKLDSLFAVLAETHVTALSIDSSTSARAISEALEDKIIVGNVSTHLLEKGTPEQVKKAAWASLSQGVKVLAPACGLSMSTPLINLQAMASVVREYNPDIG